MIRLVLAAALALGLAACGDKKQPPADDAGGGSEATREPATNTVTPDSVKREVEGHQQQHERRVDESLDL